MGRSCSYRLYCSFSIVVFFAKKILFAILPFTAHFSLGLERKWKTLCLSNLNCSSLAHSCCIAQITCLHAIFVLVSFIAQTMHSALTIIYLRNLNFELAVNNWVFEAKYTVIVICSLITKWNPLHCNCILLNHQDYASLCSFHAGH